jgi:hypothetical protein
MIRAMTNVASRMPNSTGMALTSRRRMKRNMG